jgi:predicted 3-demethylubiquinone-9 3-methyltransferase (glyoxalase superfamily)
MQKITPFLWFDKQAEEAVRFYASIFKNSKVGKSTHYDDESAKAAGMPKGTVMTVAFELEGQEFVAINGGPHFKFTEAISFVINCESQEEVDYYWEKLGEGGDPNAQMCGWLKDRFGLSWQVVPTILSKLLEQQESHKSQRVTRALLQMKKLDIQKLKQAAEQE